MKKKLLFIALIFGMVLLGKGLLSLTNTSVENDGDDKKPIVIKIIKDESDGATLQSVGQGNGQAS